MSPTVVLVVLGVLFVVTHFVMSHLSVRNVLVARLGERGFFGAYSVVATVVYVPLVWVWWNNRHVGGLFWTLRSDTMLRLFELLGVASVGLLVAGVVTL